MEPELKANLSMLKAIQSEKCQIHKSFTYSSIGISDSVPRKLINLCKLCDKNYLEKKPTYPSIIITDVLSNDLKNSLDSYKQYCLTLKESVSEIENKVAGMIRKLEESVLVSIKELSIKLTEEIKFPELSYLEELENNLSSAEKNRNGEDTKIYLEKYMAIQKEYNDFCENLTSCFLFKLMNQDVENSLKETFTTFASNFGQITKTVENLFDKGHLKKGAEYDEKNPLYKVHFNEANKVPIQNKPFSKDFSRQASTSPKEHAKLSKDHSSNALVEANTQPEKKSSNAVDLKEINMRSKIDINFGIHKNISLEKLKADGWVHVFEENYVSTFEEATLKNIKKRLSNKNNNNILVFCVGAIDPLKNKDTLLISAFGPQEILNKSKSANKARLVENVYWYFYKNDSFGFSSTEEISLENGDKLVEGDRLSWPFVSEENIPLKLNWKPAGYNNPIYSMMNLSLSRLRRIILYKLIPLSESGRK